MAIYVPGRRDRHNRVISKTGRSVVAVLTLTAMVDMFTVLVVFLLQNYKATGQVVFLPKQVQLPKAHAVKDLTPSNVVTVSQDQILLNKTVVAKTSDVQSQTNWMIQPLFDKLKARIQAQEQKAKSQLSQQIMQAVQQAKNGQNAQNLQDQKNQIQKYRRVTVQADKRIDFLTVKKVMFTVTEAGAAQINFAVIQLDKNSQPQTN